VALITETPYVSGYQTTDLKVHTTSYDACKHQMKLDLVNWLRERASVVPEKLADMLVEAYDMEPKPIKAEAPPTPEPIKERIVLPAGGPPSVITGDGSYADIECSNCHKFYSSSQSVCPHCGHDDIPF